MIIRDVSLVTMNDRGEVLRHVDVEIRKDRFTGIRPTGGPLPAGEEIIDGRGKVMMPGLMNMHSHIAMSLFRNYGNDVNLQTWLEEYIWPREALLTEEDIRAGSALNIAEMLTTGTTCFVDMYYEMDGVAREVERMGIRACLTRGLTGPDDGTRLKEQRKLYEDWHGRAGGRIRVKIGPHAIYTNDLDSLKAQKALNDELGCGFHIHIAETKKEVDDCLDRYGMTPVALFDRLGMLDGQTLAAHCVWLSEEDIQILAERGVHCIYNPASNMKLASGFMPVEDLMKAGVNVCLGTDGASSNNKQDMFREMYLGALIQKGRFLDPKALSAGEMLRMATINGAKALGLDEELGSVEPGKKADFILVDFDNVHHTPYPEDLEAALVYSTDGRDVVLTAVDGQILVKDGKLLSSAGTEEDIRQRAEIAWKRVCEEEK